MPKVREGTVHGERWWGFAMSPGTEGNSLHRKGVVFKDDGLDFDTVEAICARFGVLVPDWTIEKKPKFFCNAPKHGDLVLCVQRWKR